MRCSLCGCEIEGFGNNPYPLMIKDDERCCGYCDLQYVIPARILEVSAGVQLDRESAAELVRDIRAKERG